MIRVLLVNDITLVSNLIAALLEGIDDIAAVGSVTTVEEALDRIRDGDVVLVSAHLPDEGALRLTRAVDQSAPGVKVLVLGLTENRDQVLKYVEAGAAGYVLKDDSADDLVTRIRAASNGEALISPEVTAAVLSRLAELATRFAEVEAGLVSAEPLTAREQEVLSLIARGLTNQAIADHLVVEVGTVKNHVHSILQKLNVSSRRDAAAYAETLRVSASSATSLGPTSQ